eukprot:gene14428-30709_t
MPVSVNLVHESSSWIAEDDFREVVSAGSFCCHDTQLSSILEKELQQGRYRQVPFRDSWRYRQVQAGMTTVMGTNCAAFRKTTSFSVKGEVSDEFIQETILGNSLWTGHLMEFCQAQFNAENLNFLLSVRRFQELMANDKTSWKTPWQEIDLIVFSDQADTISLFWPSNIVNRSQVIDMMQQIQSLYLDDDAEDNICMSLDMYKRTVKRMMFVDLYGPNVFAETAIDPMKTIKKDIIPRFHASPYYTEMMENIRSGAKTYVKKAPPKTQAEKNADMLVVVSECRNPPKENIVMTILLLTFVTYPRKLFLTILSYFTRKAVADPNSKLLRSLLSKQWSYAVPGTIALNVFLNIILGVEHYFSSEP